MSSPARKLNATSGQMDLQKLESELLSLPFVVRQHLATRCWTAWMKGWSKRRHIAARWSRAARPTN